MICDSALVIITVLPLAIWLLSLQIRTDRLHLLPMAHGSEHFGLLEVERRGLSRLRFLARRRTVRCAGTQCRSGLLQVHTRVMAKSVLNLRRGFHAQLGFLQWSAPISLIKVTVSFAVSQIHDGLPKSEPCAIVALVSGDLPGSQGRTNHAKAQKG